MRFHSMRTLFRASHYHFYPNSHNDTRTLRRVTNIIKSPVHFGVIPHDHWFQPDWVDETRATAARQKMVADDIIYGGKCPHVCIAWH